ncbi:MAG: DUF4347 domain-containing protein, partial [Thalassobaculaceae bacterium]|nr:DUF4347 domain-containing protein [Thalassobaculaceae bacterium]
MGLREGGRRLAIGGGREVLFVDPGIACADHLLAGLRAGVDIVWLPASGDALAAMALTLVGRRNIGGLHILAHGAPGILRLSGAVVDRAGLASRPALIDTIRHALAGDAEIILYGCSVAGGAAGAAFVTGLTDLLGCPVLACEHPVGGAGAGGTWPAANRLPLAFDAAATATYPGLLPAFTFSAVTTANTVTTLSSTESGVTINAVASDGQIHVTSGGVDGNAIVTKAVITNTTTVTYSFSQAVTITGFQIIEYQDGDTGSNYTFTPNSGTAVSVADDDGALSGNFTTLNPGDWTSVTSFTASWGAGAGSWRLGIDTIAFSIAVDTNAPTISTPDLIASSDSGSSSTDNLTNAATPTVVGTTEANATVFVVVDGATIGSTTADGSGNWTFTINTTLTSGTHTIAAAAKDASSNLSPNSSDLTITVDTTAPGTLGTPDLLDVSDLGVSSTDNITSSATQQFSGSATTGDIVSILVG